MKIRLTERQYSELIKEATWSGDNYKKMDSIIDSFKSDSKRFNQSRLGMVEFFNLFFNIYGFNVGDVMNNKKFTEYKKILNMGTPEQKFNNLHTLYYRFYSFIKIHKEYELLSEIDKHLDTFKSDMVDYIVKTYDPVESIKRLSLLNMKTRGRDNIGEPYHVAKEIANKNGITLISKHMGYSFNRKDDSMIRDLVDYMKDISDIKKTKRGFLDYIGSHYSGGQYSHFWAAANHSGIIEKVGGGSNVTYKLGPNYEGWEDNKVVAF